MRGNLSGSLFGLRKAFSRMLSANSGNEFAYSELNSDTMELPLVFDSQSGRRGMRGGGGGGMHGVFDWPHLKAVTWGVQPDLVGRVAVKIDEHLAAT